MSEGEAWRQRIEKVQDVPPSLLNSEVFWSVYEPVIRADLFLFKKYEHVKQSPFDIPVTVLICTEDDVTAEEG